MFCNFPNHPTTLSLLGIVSPGEPGITLCLKAHIYECLGFPPFTNCLNLGWSFPGQPSLRKTTPYPYNVSESSACEGPVLAFQAGHGLMRFYRHEIWTSFWQQKNRRHR